MKSRMGLDAALIISTRIRRWGVYFFRKQGISMLISKDQAWRCRVKIGDLMKTEDSDQQGSRLRLVWCMLSVADDSEHVTLPCVSHIPYSHRSEKANSQWSQE